MADWSDYEELRQGISRNTVDRLKIIINALNEECGTHIGKTGRKQEIIDKLHEQLDVWKRASLLDKWAKARGILLQMRSTGSYSSSSFRTTTMYQPTQIKPFAVNAAGTSSIGRYDPYAPPRKASDVSSATAPSTSQISKPTGIRFKPSPFFRADQLVSTVVECPESTSTSDRRQQNLSFSLTEEQLSKLKSTVATYQLRLFCTSSTFYNPAMATTAFRPSIPCPIEFPPTCEVRVNGNTLSSNMKGLKKKPGTAPPANLGAFARHTTALNRLDMIYVNSQQPVQIKKYYLVVMLVEVTTVDQLVAKLKKGKYRSGAEIQRKMKDSLIMDDEIVAGPQKMSLKCPLSYMRVNTPCRSSQCTHPQCFDATSWFSVMEQTTTFLCPVCEKTLNAEELIVDGYFDDILKQSPESVEDVIVEADGEWHTSDNKYGSQHWKVTHPVVGALKPPPPAPQSTAIRSTSTNDSGKPKAKPTNEIFVLDSDDEEEGQVKRELSPSYAASGSSGSLGNSVPRSQTEEVIDLTLSDDDEPEPTVQAGKRKATSAIEPDRDATWKKARTVMTVASLTNQSGGSSTSTNNRHAYPHQNNSHQNNPTQSIHVPPRVEDARQQDLPYRSPYTLSLTPTVRVENTQTATGMSASNSSRWA